MFVHLHQPVSLNTKTTPFGKDLGNYGRTLKIQYFIVET